MIKLSDDIAKLVESDNIEAAIDKISEILEKEVSADAYYYRGRLYWRLGNKSRAISDYCHAVELNPESEAREALKMATSIMDFYNKEIYNP